MQCRTECNPLPSDRPLFQQYFTKLYKNRRAYADITREAGGQRKAWGVSPRTRRIIDLRAREAGGSALSHVPVIVFDSIHFKVRNEFISKRHLAVMFLLSRQILLNFCNM